MATVAVNDLVSSGEAELTTGPFGTQLKASEYVPVGVPVINVRNVGFGEIRTDKLEYVTEETANRLGRHRLKPGDIVFGRKGAVERHALMTERHLGWVQGSDCLRLRLSSSRYVSQWVSYFLRTEQHQKWMVNQCSHGATMASLNQDILGRIELPVLDVSTQLKVVRILSAYDELIENNMRRMEILEKMAQAIYREWFVNFRYPGHEAVPLVDSELGPIPEGWSLKPVGDSFDIVGGGTPSKEVPEYWEPAEVDWYTPTDLTAARSMFVFSSGKRISPAGLQKSSARLFAARSVMMTSRATIGVVSITTGAATTNQGFITCLPNELVSEFQLYFWLRDNVDHFIALGTGSTFKEIIKSTFKTIPFVTPDRATADRFRSVCEPIGGMIENLQKSNYALRSTRDLLLPRLISGEVDVSELDIDVGELVS